MSQVYTDLAHAYRTGELCGWAEVTNPGIAREQFELISREGFVSDALVIQGQQAATAGRKMMLYSLTRKLLGKDTPNYGQQIGDCVSFGAKNAIEYLQAAEQLLKGDKEKWRPVFPPYLYGTGRVYVGGGRLGNGDGSLGSWMAKAVMQYGVLFSDEAGVPRYSGQVAKAWGDPSPRPDLDQWKPTAQKYLVRSAALVRSWDELVAAICNGYPCTVASNIGYSMMPSSDGFHRQTDNWGHQMCFVGVDDNDRDPYAIILNSWGDAHGHLKDFDSGEALPVGCLRVRRRDAEKHLAARETFAYSSFDGFPDQTRQIERKLFDLIGND